VIARKTALSRKGKSPDVRHVGRAIGYRYALDEGRSNAAAIGCEPTFSQNTSNGTSSRLRTKRRRAP
jgi:hypothetical protein